MQQTAENKESKFINSLLKNTEKDSPAYMYGHALWIEITGRAYASVNFTKPEHFDRLLKKKGGLPEIIEKFIPNISSVNDWKKVDMQPALSAFFECGIYHKGFRFWADVYDDVETYQVVNDGSLSNLDSELDLETYQEFEEELEKSKSALAKIQDEFGGNISNHTDRHPLENILDHQKNDEDRLIVANKYEELRGHVVNPESGIEGFDPLIHLTESVFGCGAISFFDKRYLSVSTSDIKDEVYDLANKDLEFVGLIDLARKNALDRAANEINQKCILLVEQRAAIET